MTGIVERARAALDLLQQGRTALAAVVSSIKDGSAAISTSDQAELDRLLARERQESQAAHASLTNALDEADRRGDGAGG